MARGDKFNSMAIEFDVSRCLHTRSVWGLCSLCVRSCPSGAIHVEADTRVPVLDAEQCINCGQCLAACPLDAYTSPQFSERQLLNRVSQTTPVRLHCYLPYGEVEDLSTGGEYRLGSCLASITAGGLFELAFKRPCTLVTSHCANCQFFEQAGSTLRCNEEAAWALLSDWGKEANLQESVELFLPQQEEGVAPEQKEDEAAKLQRDAEGVLLAETQKAQTLEENTLAILVAENVKSSIRSLFHGRRSRVSRPARQRNERPRFHTKRQHIPLWRQRLEKHYEHFGPSQGNVYPWPELVIDQAKCRTCGTCMQLCPTGCLQQKLENDTFSFTFIPGRCTNCGLCIASCSTGALSRAYQTLAHPFEVQTLISRSAVACKRCGLPVFDGPEYDTCLLCRSEPKVEGIMERIREQLGVSSK